MKRCPMCGTEKPLSEFYRDGRGAYCKPCTKASVLQWAKENPEQFRRTQRRSIWKRIYGLTEDDVAQMLAAQDGICPICATPLDDDSMVIDHNHETGQVRAVLCSRCNRSIGLLRDDPAVIRAAIAYLGRGRPPGGAGRSGA